MGVGASTRALVTGFDAESMTLEKAFIGKNVFEVPVYQRPYVWTTRQAEHLFEDLRESFLGDYPHFLGSMVVAREGDDASVAAEVIDGQQRLTTIFILLQCIRHFCTDQMKDAVSMFMNQTCNLGFKVPNVTVRVQSV